MSNKSKMMLFVLVILFNEGVGTASAPYARLDPSSLVSIKATATGCEPWNEASSILINGQEHSLMQDGANIVSIDPNGIIKQEHIGLGFKDFVTRIAMLRRFSLIPTGTVFVVVTQNICDDLPRFWYRKFKTMAIISTGRDMYTWNRSRTGLIFGCRGHCPPYVVKGKLPMNNFSDHDSSMVMEVKFGLKGYKNETTEKPKEKEETHRTIIIILVIIILILIATITIIILCIRNKEKWKNTTICIGWRVKRGPNKNISTTEETADCMQQQEIYEGLRRPSALPNFYEPLQKMSVQYEEIKEIDENENDNDNTKKLRADTNLSLLSTTSLGTSKNIFRKISSEVLKDNEGDFASYIQVDDTKAIYKTPSGVQKFEPPKTTPQNTHRESYIAMETNEYDAITKETDNETSEYARLTGIIDPQEQEHLYSLLNN